MPAIVCSISLLSMAGLLLLQRRELHGQLGCNLLNYSFDELRKVNICSVGTNCTFKHMLPSCQQVWQHGN